MHDPNVCVYVHRTITSHLRYSLAVDCLNLVNNTFICATNEHNATFHMARDRSAYHMVVVRHKWERVTTHIAHCSLERHQCASLPSYAQMQHKMLCFTRQWSVFFLFRFVPTVQCCNVASESMMQLAVLLQCSDFILVKQIPIDLQLRLFCFVLFGFNILMVIWCCVIIESDCDDHAYDLYIYSVCQIDAINFEGGKSKSIKNHFKHFIRVECVTIFFFYCAMQKQMFPIHRRNELTNCILIFRALWPGKKTPFIDATRSISISMRWHMKWSVTQIPFTNRRKKK